jgi:hypothetical protein
VYRCLSRLPDALFDLADAVLCKQDRVHMLAELSLEPSGVAGEPCRLIGRPDQPLVPVSGLIGPTRSSDTTLAVPSGP